LLDGESTKSYITRVEKLDNKEYKAELKRVRKIVKAAWNEIESRFEPERKKY